MAQGVTGCSGTERCNKQHLSGLMLITQRNFEQNVTDEKQHANIRCKHLD